MTNKQIILILVFATAILSAFGYILLSNVPIASAATATGSYSCSLSSPNGIRFSIVSNSNALAYGPDTNGLWINAIPTYDGNPAWAVNSIPGATWIWDNYTASDPSIEQTVYFSSNFVLPGNIEIISANLIMGVDNYAIATLNSNTIGSSINSFGNVIDTSYGTTPGVFNDVMGNLGNGNNNLQFEAINGGYPGSSPESNPAGLLYNLTVCYNPQIAITGISVSSVADLGQPISLSASATGGTGTYTTEQWYFNSVSDNATGTGTAITNNGLLTTTNTPAGSGYYYLVVSDGNSTTQATTPTFAVTVNTVPIISITPSSTSINTGGSVTFTNTTTGGTRPYTFNYIVNNTAGVSINGNSITFANVGTYNIMETVTDAVAFTANSTNVIVTVNSAPSNGRGGGGTTAGIVGSSKPVVTTLNTTTTVTTTIPSNSILNTTGGPITSNAIAPISSSTTVAPTPPASSLGSNGTKNGTPPSGAKENWELAGGLILLILILLILYYFYHYHRKGHRERHHTKKVAP